MTRAIHIFYILIISFFQWKSIFRYTNIFKSFKTNINKSNLSYKYQMETQHLSRFRPESCERKTSSLNSRGFFNYPLSLWAVVTLIMINPLTWDNFGRSLSISHEYKPKVDV